MSDQAKVAAAAAKAAKAAAAKAASAKMVATGAGFAAFAGRRALWPAFGVGAAFASAAWFGVFELALGASGFILPTPADASTHSQRVGYATIPVAAGSIVWLGSKLAPPTAPLPSSVMDTAGLMSFARSLPLGHYGKVGVASAVGAATCCRVVQWRAGRA
jgi:hypothetical protein